DVATNTPRPSAAARGYDRTWRRLRRMYLARHPLCEHCLRYDDVTPATEVDHIVSLRDGGERLDVNNLQSLCRACHARKTAQEQRDRGGGRG
ncbi:MAG: HNH endonuclease, partial [Planctomycetes bacterium]|nr:HNH endonuclease [Planctomycetota bacterium]